MTGDRYPGFESCAIIEVDLKHLATPQTLKTNPLTGQQYYSLEYKIGIFFGGTALKACYIWEEDVSQSELSTFREGAILGFSQTWPCSQHSH